MQIFDDKKKRIGTLSGFKDRAITTTLDSGDKELTFDYPASGALVDLLKEVEEAAGDAHQDDNEHANGEKGDQDGERLAPARSDRVAGHKWLFSYLSRSVLGKSNVAAGLREDLLPGSQPPYSTSPLPNHE